VDAAVIVTVVPETLHAPATTLVDRVVTGETVQIGVDAKPPASVNVHDVPEDIAQLPAKLTDVNNPVHAASRVLLSCWDTLRGF
jgi:hypothetical protein